MFVRAAAFTAFISFTSSGVDAHGTLAFPRMIFTGHGYAGNPAALVPTTVLTPGPGDRFNNYPDASLNAAAFERAFKKAKYKTLKEFILKNQDMSKGYNTMPKTAECGFTDPTRGEVQPLPDVVEWWGGRMNHDGPCEMWCDNEIVMPVEFNCRNKYPNGKFPYNKTKCRNKKRLSFYWMSTIMEWQVYPGCAKIGEGGPPASTPTGYESPSSDTEQESPSSGSSDYETPSNDPPDSAPPAYGPPKNAPPAYGPPNNAPPSNPPNGPPHDQKPWGPPHDKKPWGAPDNKKPWGPPDNKKHWGPLDNKKHSGPPNDKKPNGASDNIPPWFKQGGSPDSPEQNDYSDVGDEESEPKKCKPRMRKRV